MPVDRGDRVLDLSGDRGETARQLVAAGASVVALRRGTEAARSVAAAGAEARVAPDLLGAGLAPEAFAAVIAAPGDVLARVDARSLRLLFASLVPGGVLHLSLLNPPWAFGPGRWLRRFFYAEADDVGGGPFQAITARRVAAAGFVAVKTYAALPDRPQTKFLVPLGETTVAAYFLENMVGGAGRKRRLALGLARLAVSLGVFGDLVPAYELTAERPEAEKAT